jgi:hypothetical protein
MTYGVPTLFVIPAFAGMTVVGWSKATLLHRSLAARGKRGVQPLFVNFCDSDRHVSEKFTRPH